MSEYVTSSDLRPCISEDALIAILPVHARRIYKLAKTFEFRKTIPRIIPRRMFLYETAEVRALTGHAVIDDIISGPPDRVWQLCEGGGATRASFDEYFSGRNVAYAYHLATAVRYSAPLALSQILAIEPGFRVPQQFLYLQNVPKLHHYLRKLAVSECLSRLRGHVTLREINSSERTVFIRSVEEHISKGYSETGRSYAKRLLSISDEGDDPEGFLTTGKVVRAVVFRKKRVGFVVLTFKLGGSVKTGPVILSQSHRSKGVGKRLREQIHRATYMLGYRKVFATVPADNVPAYQYLLSSGYRIEAHLLRPYHPKHDELVLGCLLDRKRGPGPEFIRQITPVVRFERISEPLPEITSFLEREFSSAYCRVPEGWATRQVRMACWAERRMQKPRLVFAASSDALLAVSICLLKRGGSAKLIVVTKTGHHQSLTDFLRYIEDQVIEFTEKTVRRVYSQIPAKDSDLIQAFLDFGYGPEGVIQQPFSPNSDTLILAKQL